MSTDRRARSWHVQIRALKFSCFVAEDEAGRPVEFRMIGGGPLAITLADLCEALTIGLRAGVPVGSYTRTMRGRRDELGGPVQGDPLVSDCGSIGDYIARAMEKRFP